MIARNARRHLTVCAAQGKLWLVMPHIVRLSVLPKGDDGIPCSMSSDRVCCPRAIMACHARCRLNIYATQGTCRHAQIDVVPPYVKCKSDDGMLCPTSYDCMCYPRDMMASLA